jgi:hypothetical protein
MKAKSVIKSTKRTDDDAWHKDDKAYYPYWVEMEDGVSGKANSTSPDKTPYQVGDEVEYTKTENTYGVSLRISKVNKEQGDKQRYWEEKDARISNQWAITTALEYLKMTANSANQLTEDQIKIEAKNMLHMRDNLNTVDTPTVSQDEKYPY